MIKLKKVLLSGLLLVGIGVLTIGCSSKPVGEPVSIIEEYYSFINSSEYDKAYDMLSKNLKKDITKEDFNTWYGLVYQVSTDADYKFDAEEEGKEVKLDGEVFPYATKVKVSKKSKDLYSNKTDTSTNEEYVVSEEDKWKVYRLKEDLDIKKFISANYLSLGWMYASGKNVTLDHNQAIVNFNKSIEYHENYSSYYALSHSLIDANRLDEAIEASNKSLEFIERDIKESTKDVDKNEIISNTKNLLAVAYQNKGEIEKAKEYYNSAIELNPNNEYAKTNLANLQ